MSTDLYVPESEAKALQSSRNIGIFFRMSTTPPLCVWMGDGNIKAQMPGLDSAPIKYAGAGQLLSIPDLEVLINGLANEAQFPISGFNQIIKNIIDTEDMDVTGDLVTVGYVGLDNNYQPLGPIIRLWTGTGDYLGFDVKPQPDPTVAQPWMLILNCISGDITRARSGLMMFTPSSQRLISSTDRFFERVPRYVQNLLISWPRFSGAPFILAIFPLLFLGYALGVVWRVWGMNRKARKLGSKGVERGVVTVAPSAKEVK